ncbi:rhodanese-like domain-containing protein [Lutibacter holmesii]|uniref:Rhodanese-like domain-containing protein n=1 Tax=Lutibacter holmesii TaxID=1137985 RepID=A0ABW3WT22_9FLAO
MRKLHLIVIGLLFVPTFFLTSCDQGDEPEVLTPAFTLLKDHMINNNLDIDKIITNADGEKFVVAAPAEADLAAFLDKFYIIDIRSATDFATSHIEGAKNVAFSTILNEGTNAGSKPVLIVCYTGQTACYGTALMRLYGFSHTRALKWGMSGWNSATAGSWNKNVNDVAKDTPSWSYEKEITPLVLSDPTISSLSQSGEAILKSRVELAVQEGFKTVTNADVVANPSGYFINNYFSGTDYIGFGHLTDAYRILPLTLADNSYKGLDPTPGAKVVTYCYTGQTSAVVTACLRVLGYDAYSLTFGMNGLYHSNSAWTSNQWGVGSSVPKELTLVN